MNTVIGDLFVRLGVDLTALHTNLDSAEKRVERFGTQLFFLGSRITAGVSLPMTAALGVVGKFGMDFDKAMTESLAIMDSVGPKVRSEMEGVAKSLVDITKFSATEGAEGFYHLASAGLDAATQMGALPVVARFAQAGVMDLAKATEFLAGAQAAMSDGTESAAVKVAQMARVADVLTLANNRALGTIQDFAEALTNKAGAALRQTHKDIEEGVAVLAAYASQNIKGKNAGQQLWMVIRDLGTYALKNADAFRKHQIAVFDATGAMRNMADIIGDIEKATVKMSDAQRAAMFIELGLPLRSVAATKALLGYSEAIREHEKALRNAAGTTQQVADNQMQALTNQVIQLKNQFAAAAIDLFKGFVPTIRDYVVPLVRSAMDVFKGLASFLVNMPDPLKAVALGFSAVMIALGPIITMFGSFTLLASATMRGISAIADVFGALAIKAGVASGSVNFLALSTAELRAIQMQAYMSAMTAANAQGIFGAAAIDAGLAAQAEATAIIELRAAQAGITASSGAMAGALAVLSNPITWLIGGIAALGAGWLIYKQYQDAGTEAIANNADSLRKQAKELDGSLTLFDLIHGKVTTNITLNTAYAGAVDNLAKSSGLSRDAFLKETSASDQLTASLREQAKARHELLADVENKQRNAVADALETVASLQGQLDRVMSGRATTQVYQGEGMYVSRPLTADERVKEVERIQKALDEAKKAADAASDAYRKFMGARTQDISLPFEGKALSKDEIEARFQEELARVKAAKGDVAALESAWRSLRFPAGGGGGVPDLVTDKKKTDFQKMFEDISGKEIQDNIITTTAVFNKLIESGKHLDPAVHERMWEAYKKLRGETDALEGPFGRLFRQEQEDYDLKIRLAHATENWGATMSDAADKMIGDIDNVQVALFRMNDAQKGAFFTKHEGTIKELIPLYDTLEPKVQMLIIAYQRWKMAAGDGGEFRKGAAAAMTAMDDMLAKSTARLEDAQTELLRSTQSAGDAHRNTLKSNLAKIAADQDKAYRQALTKLATQNDAEYWDYVAKLKAMKAADAEYLKVYEANESFKYAASIGVNRKLLRDWAKMSQAQRDEIIRTREAWVRFMRDMQTMVTMTNNLGGLFGSLGQIIGGIVGQNLEDFGKMIEGVGKSSETFLKGMDEWDKADGPAGKMNALIMMAQGVVQAFQNMQQQGTRSMRALSGAMSGAQIGNMIAPGWGAVIGAGIGALAGLMMGDPGWKQVQQTAGRMWHEKVSKELAKQIDKDSTMLGGHVNATLLHLSDIAAEAGGITAQNVGKWSDRLAQAFSLVSTGEMTTAQASKVLDTNFQNLVESGTRTNGIVADQIIQLVRLEKQYRSGSKAIHDFIDAQLGIAVSGFTKIVEGTAGFMMQLLGQQEDADAALERRNGLRQKEMRLQAQIADYEKNGVKNEKQRVALAIARIELTRTQMEIKREEAKHASADAALQQLAGPEGQTVFDRLSRLGMVTFDALVASGKPLVQILEEMGPALDTLIASQDAFGFSTSDAFQQLMKFREFASTHEELVNELDGINQMMQGLTNTGYMTTQTFNDLGDEAASVFARMVEGGLTSDEALQLMQPTLQTLWELQHQYGFAVDDVTGKLLDQAETAGLVGAAHMSATDRMIAGIDKLIGRFDLLLKKFGVDIPADAAEAAQAVEDAFSGVHPDIEVGYHYTQYGEDIPTPDVTPVPMAEGGVLTRPILAGEAGPEAIIPLDRLFDELRLKNDSEPAPSGDAYYYSVTIQTIDGPSTERFVNSPEFGTAFRRAARTNTNDMRSTIRETAK